MFDFRYHALSLAAVFIALVVGLLLGVAIGDKELVSSAERRHSAVAARRRAPGRPGARRGQGAPARRSAQFVDAAYPDPHRRPAARPQIGLVLLGENEGVPGVVDKALEPTGGRSHVRRHRARRRRPQGARDPARGIRYERLAPDPTLLDDLGKRIGIQAVEGGKLINDARMELMSSTSGQFGGLDCVIVMCSPPADTAGDKQAGV